VIFSNVIEGKIRFESRGMVILMGEERLLTDNVVPSVSNKLNDTLRDILIATSERPL